MNLIQTSTRIVATAAAAAVAVTGAVTAHRGAYPSRAAAAVAQAPDRSGPALQTFALEPGTGASPTGKSFSAPTGARAEAMAGGLAVAQRRTRPFALLGATWTDPKVTLDGTVQVRTRSAADGIWSAWRSLDVDEPTAVDPGGEDGPGRGSTDPVWVGDSDGVEARVAAADGRTRPLPAGLRLDLINPDTGAPAMRPAAYTAALPPARTAKTATARAAAVTIPPRPVPKVVTRAGWGANEQIVTHPPQYTSDVQVLFVHHTADSNGYSCSDSARIVRGIEAYHVRSKGWNDIGYNFLVDKCGTLFEGRKGGVNRPVLGAHTLGFNSHSAAIAVIGNYTGRGVSTTVKNVIAQVAAYKLGMYGNLATGRTAIVSSGSTKYANGTRVNLNRISGHRDTGYTECPGDDLYAQLPSIRAIAGAGPAGFGLARVTGAAKVGAAYYTRGLIRPLWTTSTPSGLMNRFDVFVDGEQVASAARAERTALLRLASGRHTVTVRAMHLSGRTASTSATVIVDRSAPAYTTGPSVVLRSGSLSGSVPVRLGWAATDVGGLRSVELTSPSTRSLGVTAHSWSTTAAPGRPTTWTLRATDRAGNASTASTTRTPVLMSEAEATRTGHWVTQRNPAYLNGTALRSTTAASSMTWTFTGRSASLAVSRTAVSGRVRVYVDGAYSGVLDLGATATQYRQAIWARSWSSTVQHTVKIMVEGTAGRPGVIMDGLVYLR